MEPQESSADAVPEPVLFRPSKKRKVFRQRASDSPSLSTLPDPPISAPDQPSVAEPPRDQVNRDSSHGSDDDNPSTISSAALRARNARKARARAGMAFHSSESRADSSDPTSRELVFVGDDGREAQPAQLVGIQDRFAHQTGLISDTANDKHMNAYIESRLYNRSTASKPDTTNPSLPKTASSALSPVGKDNKPFDHSTSQGKLMEVDIADIAAHTRRRNQAADALASGAVGAGGSIAKKPRLGPDGKPWRGRKRRGSDDVKRDQLVEAFLHENRLDVYEPPPPATETTTDSAAAPGSLDERLAEQFQRQYMDDMALRKQQQKKRPTNAAPDAAGASKAGVGANGEDVLKGPKLGGSRNARAAVRDALLKQEKEAAVRR